MYKPITVQFSHEERRKIEQLTDYYKSELAQSRQNTLAQRFKNTLLSYLISNQKQLSEKNRLIRQIQYLIRQKQFSTQNNQPFRQIDWKQLINQIKIFKDFVREKIVDSKSYNFYVTYLSQLRDLTSQNLLQFEINLKQRSPLVFEQKQNLLFLANKIAKSNDEVSQFLSEIVKYGFNKQIKSLSAIKDEKLQIKCQALVEDIVNNYIQVQPKRLYGLYARSPLKQFLQALTKNYYSRQQVSKTLRNLPQKLQVLFQPLFLQIYQLRQNQNSNTKASRNRTGFYQETQMKLIEEQSRKQLLSDYAQANKKIDKLQAELKQMQWFIKVVSSIGINSKQKSLHRDIANYIQNHQIKHMRLDLLKIYQKFNNYEEKEPVNKVDKRKQKQFIKLKPSPKKPVVQDSASNYKHHIAELQQQIADYITQRAQLQQIIKWHKDQLEKSNSDLKKFQRTLRKLQQFQRRTAELQNVNQILQESNSQLNLNLTKQRQKYQKLDQMHKLCANQKQQMRQNITTLTQRQKSKTQSKNRGQPHQYQQDKNLQSKQKLIEFQNQQLKEKIQRLQSQITQLTQAASYFKSMKDEVKNCQNTIQKLKQQNNILTTNLQKLLKEGQPVSPKRRLSNQEQDAALSQITKLKKAIQNLTINQANVKQQLSLSKKSQQKLKQNYRQLYEHFTAQKEKLSALKNQNDALKEFKAQKQQSPPKQRYSEESIYLIQKYQNYKASSQSEILKKQKQIDQLREQLSQSFRMNESSRSSIHQEQIRKEKLEYLEGRIGELEEQNSRFKIELERKEREILTFKINQSK